MKQRMTRSSLLYIDSLISRKTVSQSIGLTRRVLLIMSGTSLSSLLSQVKQAYDTKSSISSVKGKTSTTPVSAILVQAKISLAQSGLLLPGTSASQSKSDLQYAREILSYGALLSLKNGDVAGFERFLAQVKPFWDPSLQWVLYSLTPHRERLTLCTQPDSTLHPCKHL